METNKKNNFYKEPSYAEKIEFLKEKVKEITKSPEASRAFLERAGILPFKKNSHPTKK